MNVPQSITSVLLVSLMMMSGLPLAHGGTAPPMLTVREMEGPAPVLVERLVPSEVEGSAVEDGEGARTMPQVASPKPDATTRRHVNHALMNLPLRFIANADLETDPAVHFTVKGAGHTIFFTEDEVVFSASVPESRALGHEAYDRPGPVPHFQLPTHDSKPETRNSVVRLRFPGANPHPPIEGLAPMRGVVNFFLGNDPAKWRSNVPTYGAVVYRDLYPGIDLVYRGTEGHLKSEFLVAPGADPSVIQMAYSGMEALRLRADGALVLETPLGELVEGAPLIYQKVDGVRQVIPGGYVPLGENRVGFQVEIYDPAWPLVIDPELAYSTYLGGSGYDHGYGIAVDNDGNAYVTGMTHSSDFPTTPNAIQSAYGGGDYDTFVTQIISTSGVYTYGYSTYLGGSGWDEGWGISLDNGGNAHVTGMTSSVDFPIHNAVQTALRGSTDAFVTQIISAGGVYTLGCSTYLGGSAGEHSFGIILDDASNIYVTGRTHSSDFPTCNAIQTAYGGGDRDAFVTQIISTSGVYTYGYSTYLGGSGDYDEGRGIAVDDAGNIYVTGNTDSTNFPTHNAIQTYQGSISRSDAFVTQIISASGVYTLGYSTYLGGHDADCGYGIAVDDAGNAYVTGWTQSTDFPVHNVIHSPYGKGHQAFVTQIVSASGVYTYGYSVYLGGYEGSGIAVDPVGNVYVTGHTWSDGFVDAFVTQIIGVSGVYIYGYYTRLDGWYRDEGTSIAVDSVGNVYVTGYTASTDFPTHNAIQTAYGGGDYDAFVAKITGLVGLTIHKTVVPAIVAPGQPITYTLFYANNSPMIATGVLITDVVPITVTNVGFTSGGAAITPTGNVSYTWQVAAFAPGAGGVITITGVVSPAISGTFILTNRAVITTTDAAYVDTNPGNNTSVVHSTVDAEPPVAPTLVSPADNAALNDTTPTLTWDASPSPGTAGYLLDFNGTVLDVGNVTQHTPGPLADGVYTWTVAAYDMAGNTSAYTDTWSFTVDTTAPEPPTLLSLADGAVISDTTPTLTWSASPSPDVVGYLLDFDGKVLDVGNVTQHTPGPLADGTYTWTVAAYDTVLWTSPYTDTWSFTVDTAAPDPPTLLSPADGAVIGDTTPTLTWGASPSPDVVGYLLDFDGTVLDVENVTQHTPGPLADGTYTWTVAAYDAIPWTSPYTDTWSFTVDASAPTVVAVAPGNGAADVALTAPVVVTFSEAINTSTFAYNATPDPGGWSATWSDGDTVVTLIHNPFASQTTYTVTVTAADDLVGNTLSGAPYAWHFTTVSYRLYLPLVVRSYR